MNAEVTLSWCLKMFHQLITEDRSNVISFYYYIVDTVLNGVFTIDVSYIYRPFLVLTKRYVHNAVLDITVTSLEYVIETWQ